MKGTRPRAGDRDFKNRLRKLLKYAWACFLHCGGDRVSGKRKLLQEDAILVLTFHRVLSDTEAAVTSSLPGMVVRTGTFDALLRFLHDHFEVVTLTPELPAFTCGRKKLRVLLTFDDGWSDTYSNAFPLAKREAAPFTVFVCPALVGKIAPFWPERAVREWRRSGGAGFRFATVTELIEGMKRMPVHERASLPLMQGGELPADPPEPNLRTMGWPEIEELQANGIAIGSHTNEHKLLNHCTIEERRRELEISKTNLEERCEIPCLAFAYPNGNWDPEIAEEVRAGAYRYAFTTDAGAWTSTTDCFSIPRINISEPKLIGPDGKFSPAMFEYSVLRKAAGTQRAPMKHGSNLHRKDFASRFSRLSTWFSQRGLSRQ